MNTAKEPCGGTLGVHGCEPGTLISGMVINGAGTVAFKNSAMAGTGVTSGNSGGLFKLDSAGVFSKVMRQGDRAPKGELDTSGAIVFGNLEGGLNMNARGHVAFFTLLTGEGAAERSVRGCAGRHPHGARVHLAVHQRRRGRPSDDVE